ncbi:MAG: carbohydrate kinase family protein [Candidatus Bathyarchaeota archaeon]|nr:carbohydrate kinase family protein [Candidatus Bathyarchaeota archaeon A05DMB-5]MDH7557704.1 carbohydrate kinase family protein [Candidatus Bathyarchaeota archaeon]
MVKQGVSSDFLEELLDFLKNGIREFSVVVMPDFFFDRFLSISFDAESFCDALMDVIERKGGSIDGIEQAEFRGGNAINTASALAALGVNVTPIVCTSKLGLEFIRFYLKSSMVNLSRVKILEKPSITTAMEFKTEKGKANVMLRDVGSLANFGPNNLSSEDFEAIEKADYACVFNWAGTRRFGTELAETVFRHVKTKGKGKTYCDTADPTPNNEKVSELTRKVLQSKFLDILSVNENEAVCYVSQVSNELKKIGKRLKFNELAKEAAKILRSHLSARVDLHTTSFSVTFTKKGETVVPAFKVPVLRVTGAGDAWNAGNIVGDACGLSDGCRLLLANAVAAYYISSSNGLHPTREKLIEFLERFKRKSSSIASA